MVSIVEDIVLVIIWCHLVQVSLCAGLLQVTTGRNNQNGTQNVTSLRHLKKLDMEASVKVHASMLLVRGHAS